MSIMLSQFLLLALIAVVAALHSQKTYHGVAKTLRKPVQQIRRITTTLRDVPLELTGQLDPSKKWDVKFIFDGEEKVVSVSEGTSFLDVGEKIFNDVPSSCRNGICTTCAGQVVEGRDKVKLAVHGLGAPQIG
jgi:ferredoxin